MPDIDRQLFSGTEKLGDEDWATCLVADLAATTVAGKVRNLGNWNGNAAATVGLRLKADNSGVDGGRLVLIGKWDEKIKLQAKKLFQGCEENVVLEMEIGDLAVFHCREGEMASGFIPQEAVKYRYRQGEGVLSEARLEEVGVKSFSLKIVTGLSRSSSKKEGLWLNATILIFPEDADAMAAIGGQTRNPAWPGIKAAGGQIPMIPEAGRKKGALKGKEWGAPIAPLLATGAPWEAAPGPLGQAEVVAACRALLNKGCCPETVATAEAAKKRWESLLANPDQLKEKPAERTWPAPAEASGKDAQKGSDMGR